MSQKSNIPIVINFQPRALVQKRPRYYTLLISCVLVHLLVLYMTHS